MATEKISNVAVYGGAFNPPTFAHEVVARTVTAVTGYTVWMMPCYQHKFGKDLLPCQERIHMLRDTVEHTYARVSTWELDHKHTGSTYDMMVRLRETCPNVQFHVVIGADNYLCLDKWENGDKLSAEFPMIIINRHGYEMEIPNQHRLIPLLVPTLSSTEVRQAIADGDYFKAGSNIRSKVWSRIYDKGFYGCTKLKPDWSGERVDDAEL